MNTEQIQPPLTEKQGQVLVQLARATIAARLELPDTADKGLTDTLFADPVFQEKRGTFVTLKIKNQLRGCMGCLTPSETILEGIQRNAINAAFNDPRFPPLTSPELEQAEIEVSILTSPQDLHYSGGRDLLDKLRPNIDGVIISKGMARATFLPQVWEQLPRPEDFLAHLCRKAGLSPDEWQTGELDVSIYQVQYFHEKEE
jgi:AmmeMemoRadiSam system protein A